MSIEIEIEYPARKEPACKIFCKTFRIYAIGPTAEEAFRVFGAYIDHFLETYKRAESHGTITKDAQEHHDLLRRVIGRK